LSAKEKNIRKNERKGKSWEKTERRRQTLFRREGEGEGEKTATLS
jgi:hypothetical protein